MNYVTVDKPSDIKLSGIKVDFERIGTRLASVTLTDSEGGFVRFNAPNDYNGVVPLVAAPPKTEKRYVIRADLPVVGKVVKAFDSKYDEACTKMKADLDAKEIDFSEGEEDVVVDADSAPVRTVNDDIPF